MDRRESIKTMLIGALGTGALLNRCAPSKAERTKLQNVYDFSSYGRTAEEKQRDVDYLLKISLPIISLKPLRCCAI